MCLRDGARRRSRGGLRGPTWPGRPGGRRSSGDVTSGCTDGTPRGAPDAGATTNAGATTDAGPSANAGASAGATASADAPDAGPPSDAADAAAEHGWDAGAAAQFSAAQHGWHAEHVASIAAECRRSASPRHAAAARHGIAASGAGNRATGWHAGAGGRRPEPAGRAAREYRHNVTARSSAGRWLE